jgi:CHASE3 domain sensor protein
MNNEMRSHTPGGSRPSQATPQTLGRSVGTAVDSAVNAMDEAVDRGKAMASDAGAAASDMAEVATQQIKTFASELEGMARRNPLGTVAGAVIVGVLIGMMARGRG